MRNVFALLIPAVAACGGGSDTKPPVIVDQAPAVDQPQAAACPVCGPDSPCTVQGQNGPETAMSLGGLVLVKSAGTDGMLGTADDVPIGANECGQAGTNPCEWFVVPEAGANMGEKTLFILAGTPAELNTGESGSDVLLGIELKSIGGAFAPNSPNGKNFSTDPTAITSAQIFATPQGTTSYDAIAYIVSVSGTTINALYMSTSGSIITTEISDTPNSVIRGEVTSTNFSETDGMTTGGCTTTLEGLSFAMTEGQAAFQGTGSSRAQEIYKNIKAYTKTKH